MTNPVDTHSPSNCTGRSSRAAQANCGVIWCLWQDTGASQGYKRVIFRRQQETETYTTSDWDGGKPDTTPTDPVTALRVLPDGPVYALADFQDFNGPKKWISIGAGDDNDIQLVEQLKVWQRRTVSWDHCQLCRTRQGRVLVQQWPAAKNSTKVNRVRVRDGFVEIGPGDVLRAGRVRLVALSEGKPDAIKVTADSPGDYVQRMVANLGSLDKAGEFFGKNRSTIQRWLRKAGFGL